MVKRNLFRVLFLFCLTVSICNVCNSQTFNTKHLEVRNGLSNNNIADIVFDKKGVLWIATESGLNRFDGNDFKIFRKNNCSIVSNALNALLYDPESNSLWIGSQRDGISVLNCDNLNIENFTTDLLATNDVTHLSHSADSAGIWITHYHLGIEYFDKKNRTFTLYGVDEIKGLKSRNWCSLDDGKGNVYLGHEYNGVSIIDINTKSVKNFINDPNNPNSLPGNNVKTMFRDSKNNIWVGTDNGLALFDPTTETFTIIKNDPNNKESLSSNFVYSISQINNEVWIATEMSGISILDLDKLDLKDKNTFTFKNVKSASEGGLLSSANVRCITQDLYNNIWIGHYQRGIDFLSNTSPIFNTLSSIDEEKGDVKKEIWDIALDKQQQIWVGSHNEISLFKDYKLKKTIDIKPFLLGNNKNAYVNVIQVDVDNNLWLGTTNTEVIKYNTKSGEATQIKMPEGYGYIQDFLIEGHKVWIGTDNGLFSFENNILKEEVEINNLLSDRTIYNLLRDKWGRLWIGTYGRGVFVLNTDNSLLAKFEKESGFCSNAVNAIFQDSKSRVWVATQEGLICFIDPVDIDSFVVYNEQNGLADSYVRAVQEDSSGNLWFSTNSGISLYNESDNNFVNYNHQDGVSTNFINASRAIDKDGIIFFGSIKEVCYFDPKQLIESNTVLPKVEIIQNILLDQNVEVTQDKLLYPIENEIIKLAYNENSIQISFSVTDYSKEQFVEYEYEMEGLDNKWHIIKDNHIVFRNLMPGEYVFNIKARLKNQNWEEALIASQKYIITPPLWLTWYAKLFYSVIVLSIIYVLFYYYRKRSNFRTMLEIERRENLNREELNDERLRFYTNITHELRTPLTLILGPLEDLKHEKDLSKQQIRKINTIHASAIRLLNLVSQLLEFRKTETQNRQLIVAKGNISNQLKEIAIRYKELNTNGRIGIEINIEKDVHIYYDVDMFATIINNLLGNALKYTPEGQINIELYSTDQYTEILIGDTGYGIEEEKLPFIFERYYQVQGKHQASGTGIGLALVKSLVKLHEATLDVNSTVGEGTTFILRFSTQNNYPKAIHANDLQIDESVNNELDLVIDEGNKAKILVVEDDHEIRSYVVNTLNSNYHVLSAKNGQEALEMAKKHSVNLVVSDVMMPIMDGFEFSRILKQDINTSHIPIILLTAKDSIQDRELGYEIGVDSYITKPFSASLLSTRIANLLKAREELAKQLSNRSDIKEPKVEDIELDKDDTVHLSKLDNEFLEKLRNLIENNLDMESLDMTFIKENMNMSYSSFYRKVKNLTNVTPNEFVRKQKLKKSTELLDQNMYSISEIAFMSGFNDVVYFRKCFKLEYQVTPSEYIKK